MADRDKDDMDAAEQMLRDPLIQELIEEVLAPYIDMAPPALLQSMRRNIEHTLITDAYPRALMRALGVRPAPSSSGDVEVEPAETRGTNGGARLATGWARRHREGT